MKRRLNVNRKAWKLQRELFTEPQIRKLRRQGALHVGMAEFKTTGETVEEVQGSPENAKLIFKVMAFVAIAEAARPIAEGDWTGEELDRLQAAFAQLDAQKT